MWSGGAAPDQHREGEGIPDGIHQSYGIHQSETTTGADGRVDVERCRRPTGWPSRQTPPIPRLARAPGHRLVPSPPSLPWRLAAGGGLPSPPPSPDPHPDPDSTALCRKSALPLCVCVCVFFPCGFVHVRSVLICAILCGFYSSFYVAILGVCASLFQSVIGRSRRRGSSLFSGRAKEDNVRRTKTETWHSRRGHRRV
uniref:Predicted protein n=1 Tax=Hordeum vulgare subsp. vulgare TaxID=112509 RepID=F2CUI3_HORVV|nr:predicted protein [Hordeum vulgare subsp. vulgare]